MAERLLNGESTMTHENLLTGVNVAGLSDAVPIQRSLLSISIIRPSAVLNDPRAFISIEYPRGEDGLSVEIQSSHLALSKER